MRGGDCGENQGLLLLKALDLKRVQPLKTEGKFSNKLVVIFQKSKALGNIPEDLQKKNVCQKAG